MTNPIDPDAQVSAELSEIMSSLLGNPDIPEPVTLGMVRDVLLHSMDSEDPDEAPKAGLEETLLTEVEQLIDEYGDDALAGDFVSASASDALSEFIEAVLERAEDETEVMLGDVRDAVDQGLLAELEGSGLLESDDAQALVAELDALIERYGTDQPAEELLRMD
ncbi:MAG: hypothetical protein R3357_04510 [Burkholderiales bacterium]|nr:hypothetical protein [Burkholderiales bacterium]